jgi:hypothetical protein
MEKFIGTYRGFSPTDESPSGVGEAEMVVTDDTVTMRLATGLGITTRLEAESQHFVPLTAEELAARFETETDTVGVTAYRYGESGVTILFLSPDTVALPDPDEADDADVALADPPLVLVNGLLGSEAFGPTVFWAPSQSDQFDVALAKGRHELGEHAIPLLANGGLCVETAAD